MKAIWFAFSIAVLSVALSTSAAAQDTNQSAAVESQTLEQTPAAVPRPKLTLRLPRFFASLVDTRQREEIYEVRRSYQERIAQLEIQLTALKQEELAAMESVLTVPQRSRLEEMRAAVLAKAQSKRKAMLAAEPPAAEEPQSPVDSE